MIHGILMSDKTLKDLKVDAHIAVLHTKVDSLIEKQKELTQRVRANEKVVAAVTLLGTVVIAIIGAGYFAPKAEACSPPRDGSEFTCPPWDDDIAVCLSLDCPRLPIPQPNRSEITDQSFEDNLDPDVFHKGHTVTLFDTRDDDPFDVAHMGHSFPTGEWIEKIRDWESQQDRMSIDEMLNSALEDMEDNNGSNDPTKQEELLQLPSDGD